MSPVPLPVLHAHGELDLLVRAEHQGIVLLFTDLPDRGEDGEPVVAGYRGKILAPVAVKEVPVQGDRSVSDRERPVRDDQIGVKFHLYPKPVALLACPEGAVEREHPWLEFLEGDPADRARHGSREQGVVTCLIHDNQQPA